MIANTSFVEAPDPRLLWDVDLTNSLSETVRLELDRCGYLALRGVKCDVREGVARLEGRVSSYYLKQLAQHIAGCVPGIEGVTNEIKVVSLQVRSK